MFENTIKKFLKTGKEKEQQFAKDYLAFVKRNFLDTDLSGYITFSEEKQDMFEHWDLRLANLKIDVKGLKKRRRSDTEVDDSIHWVEIKNINGNLGWLYGQADAFAFEAKHFWILVGKESLQELIAEKCSKKLTSSSPQLYKLYTRNGRSDVITLVKTSDLMAIAGEFIKK